MPGEADRCVLLKCTTAAEGTCAADVVCGVLLQASQAQQQVVLCLA